jgi:hypothetical protein
VTFEFPTHIHLYPYPRPHHRLAHYIGTARSIGAAREVSLEVRDTLVYGIVFNSCFCCEDKVFILSNTCTDVGSCIHGHLGIPIPTSTLHTHSHTYIHTHTHCHLPTPAPTHTHARTLSHTLVFSLTRSCHTSILHCTTLRSQ